MMNFTEWNNRDEPQGLDGAKKRILSEGKEDFEKLAKATLKAKAEKKIQDIQNPPDASPTVPEVNPEIFQRGDKKGEPKPLPKTDKAYFKGALKLRDKLEQKPRGLDAVMPKAKVKARAKDKNEPKVTREPIRAMNDEERGDLRKRLEFLRQNINRDGAGTLLDRSIRGAKTSSNSAIMSGLDSDEDYPQLTGRLAPLAELARSYITKENENGFWDGARQNLGDDIKLAGSEFFDSQSENPLSITGHGDMLGTLESLGGRNIPFSKQGLAFPRERQALIDNFADEDSTNPEKVIDRAIRNKNVSLEDAVAGFPDLPKEIQQHFRQTGHGQGGSHPYWQTPEGEEEWGYAMYHRYLQQEGRDGYLDYEGSPVIHPQDFAADHALSFSDLKEYWMDRAREQFPDIADDAEALGDKAWRLADDPSNIIHTRFGFNQSQKDKTPLWAVRERLSKLSDEKGKAGATESVTRKAAQEIREQEYIGPLRQIIDNISGDISREEYETLRDMAHTGYDRLDQVYGRDMTKSPSLYERSVLTDPFRYLMGKVKIGAQGINTFADDRLRASDTAKKTGWQGTDGKHSATANNGNFDSEALIDPALDFFKDRLAQSFFFGGDKGKSATREIMRRVKRAGNALVTGELSTGQFTQYLKDNILGLEQLSEEGGISSPYDIEESSKKYKQILNAVAQKNILKKKVDPNDLDGDITVPKRPNMAAKIRNESLQKEFETLHQDLKSILTDEPWSEIYKDSILEEEDLDEITFLGYNINTKLM